MTALHAALLATTALACIGCAGRTPHFAVPDASVALVAHEYRAPNSSWRVVSVPRADRTPAEWSGRCVLAPSDEPLVLVRWIGHDAGGDALLFLARDRDSILQLLDGLRAAGHDVPQDARDVRFDGMAPRETPDRSWGSVWGCGAPLGFLTTVAWWDGGALSVAAARHGLDGTPEPRGRLVLTVAPAEVRGRLRIAPPGRLPRDHCAARAVGRVTWADDTFVLERALVPSEADELVRLEFRARLAGVEGPTRHLAWIAEDGTAREPLVWRLSGLFRAHLLLDRARPVRFTLVADGNRALFESPADAEPFRRASRCAQDVLERLEGEFSDARDVRLVVEQD